MTTGIPIRDADEAPDRYRSYLQILARTHLGSRFGRRVDASDIVQLTLLEAHEKRDAFRGESRTEMAGWLRTMLMNNVADAVRAMEREKRDIRRERSIEAEISDSFSRAHDWLQADHTSPSQHLVRHEEQLALADALAELPADQSEAIILHHLEGQSLHELAVYFGRSEPAVAGLLHRGLKRLRQKLKSI
jgi:RNA polymerase sigma-70 factor (ECF subfamily)